MQRIFLNLVPRDVRQELEKYYCDPSEMVRLWNRTQVRAPIDAGEVEDVFYGI